MLSANSVDPVQTPRSAKSELGLYYLHIHVSPKRITNHKRFTCFFFLQLEKYIRDDDNDHNNHDLIIIIIINNIVILIIIIMTHYAIII